MRHCVKMTYEIMNETSILHYVKTTYETINETMNETINAIIVLSIHQAMYIVMFLADESFNKVGFKEMRKSRAPILARDKEYKMSNLSAPAPLHHALHRKSEFKIYMPTTFLCHIITRNAI